MSNLQKFKVAVLATDGVEQVELTEPVKALRNAQATAVVIAPHGGHIQAMQHDEKGEKLQVDKPLSSVMAEQFDALLLPGGAANPDRLRTSSEAIAFVRHFVESGKPIAAICHGPWDPHRGPSGQGENNDILAVIADRSRQCRCQLGGPRGRRRFHIGHFAQTG